MKHIRNVFALVICLVIFNSVTLAQQLDDFDRVRAFGSVVQLQINDGDELGTGFVIDDTGIIVTNAHVIDSVDLDDPNIVVSIALTLTSEPVPLFLARPLEYRGDLLIFQDIDVAILEVYARLDGEPVDDDLISLTQLNYWSTDAERGDAVTLFGFPNITNNNAAFTPGFIINIFEGDFTSDVLFGEAGSGGPALNEDSEVVGIARARGTDQGEEYTRVISLERLCDNYPTACELLPDTEVSEDGPPARSVAPGGFLQCLNARGPSFELGDTFVVPNSGSGGTTLRRTPSWIINNRSVLLEEGTSGTILQGPVCGPAAKGELIGWFVETEDGDTGWISEGYVFDTRPWITTPELINAWEDYVPEDFNCPNSYGPNFQLGDRFIVPVGDGPTNLWANPNRAPQTDRIPEATEGVIIEGPECARGNGGLLVSWRVLTDDGLSGWASEGYFSSPAPWIAPVVERDDDGNLIERGMVLPTPPPSDCEITATTNATQRGGPGTTFDRVGSLQAGTLDYGIGQAMGNDGFVWWQLPSEGWVRSDLVTASEECADLPVVDE